MRKLDSRRGDTLLEVVLSFVIFSIIVALTINVMNSGVSSMEASLELTMARNEMDAQAETIRFIHNSFLTEREYTNQPYQEIWKTLRDLAIDNSLESVIPQLSRTDSCSALYDRSNPTNTIFDSRLNTFIMNTRKVEYNSAAGIDRTIVTAKNYPDVFVSPSLNPRIVYTNSSFVGGNGTSNTDEQYLEQYTTIGRVEGLWVIAVKGTSQGTTSGQPGFYDFHINTCWYAPGKQVPTTIGTIIRLYNPEYIEVDK